jgi:hypothetical protein
MRQSVATLLAIPAIGLASLCNASGFSRAELPTAPGNYLQVYESGPEQLIELAVVSPSGMTSTTTGHLTTHADLNKPMHIIEAFFPNCGPMLFTDRIHASANPLGMKTQFMDSAPTNYSTACEIPDMPAKWQVLR